MVYNNYIMSIINPSFDQLSIQKIAGEVTRAFHLEDEPTFFFDQAFDQVLNDLLNELGRQGSHSIPDFNFPFSHKSEALFHALCNPKK